jgi:hypothetical protein
VLIRVAEMPCDPTLKALVEAGLEAWPIFLGQAPGPTEVIEADLAADRGAADERSAPWARP